MNSARHLRNTPIRRQQAGRLAGPGAGGPDEDVDTELKQLAHRRERLAGLATAVAPHEVQSIAVKGLTKVFIHGVNGERQRSAC